MSRQKLSKNALLILKQRYLKKNEKGKVIETPNDLFRRVAKNISLADAKYKYPKEVSNIQKKYKRKFHEITETKEFVKLVSKNKEILSAEEKFYKLMDSLEFLPNSPTLFNAGRKLQQLAACFVLPIEDDIGSIFKTLRDAALIHRTGAGTGFNFSRLRPKGDIIESSGVTSGPVSFMKVFDAATEQIKLGGILRGANIGILDCTHADIEEFITIKSRENVLTNFNVSVAVTDDFIELAKKNKNYNIVNPRTGKIVRKENAARILRLMSEQAWINGDPGIIFIDRINEKNPTPNLGKIESTDSCGEQPLLPYESCNLGSINLSSTVKGGKIDFEKLKIIVQDAVHFLDNVIDMCQYPLPENRKIVEQNRKIGLGIMGFAEMLIKLGIAYDSEDGIKTAEKVMKFISEHAQLASSKLAEKRGEFPSWNQSIYGAKSKKIKLRNATATTIAPTGTTSIIADTSSGIEPLFALSYARKTAEGNRLIYFNKLLKEKLEELNIYNEDIAEKINREGTIKNIDEIPKNVREIFAVGSDIDAAWHVKMQAAFQKYVDNGISKTVTLPKDATVEDVEKIFLLAYELGCKGISIYRYGSREGQVIYLSSKRDEQITLSNFFKK